MAADMSRRRFLAGAAGLLTATATSARGKTGGLVMSRKLDLDQFVDDVRRANRERDAQRAVDEVLARTVSEPASPSFGKKKTRLPVRRKTAVS